MLDETAVQQEDRHGLSRLATRTLLSDRAGTCEDAAAWRAIARYRSQQRSDSANNLTALCDSAAKPDPIEQQVGDSETTVRRIRFVWKRLGNLGMPILCCFQMGERFRSQVTIV